MLPFIAVIIIITAFYFLYMEGLGTVNMKFALMDAVSFDGRRSRFRSCNGYMKRVVRFKEDRIYRFSLELALSKGDFWVELLDASKNTILRLDQNTPSAAAELSSGKRYRLVFRFKSASGRYRLSWE